MWEAVLGEVSRRGTKGEEGSIPTPQGIVGCGGELRFFILSVAGATAERKQGKPAL